MKLPLTLLKRIVFVCVGLLAATLLFLWLAMPRILQSQAEKFVSEKTGHRLTLARPEFSPFELRLRLADLRLTTPDDRPLASFAELVIDVSAASLTQRALVFDDITLKEPVLTVDERPDGLNWKPFFDALKSPEEKKPDSGLPRFDIRRFTLSGGQVAYADRRRDPGFATRIAPLDISLADISTLPDDSGRYSLKAKTSIGAEIELSGTLDLDPVAVAGDVTLKGLALDPLAPYVAGILPAPPRGRADLSARYHAGNTGQALDVAIEDITVRLTDLIVPLSSQGAQVAVGSVELKEGRFALGAQQVDIGSITLGQIGLELPGLPRSLELAALTLESARATLSDRQAQVGKLKLSQGRVTGVRNAEGRLPVVEALRALAASSSRATPPEPAQEAKPWQFKLAELALEDWAVQLRDESVSPAGEIRLEQLALRVVGISQDLGQALPVELDAKFAAGGQFSATGRYTPASTHVDLQVKLADLALSPAQPYVQGKLRAGIAGGRVSAQGRVQLDDQGPRYRGNFALHDLRIIEEGAANTLLGWKHLKTDALTATPQRLDIGELRLSGLDTKLMIDKEKNINLKKVLRTPAESPAASAEAPAPAVSPAPTFVVNIDRLRFYNGELYFADESLILPFGTRIHGLRGSISHLSSQRGGAHGQVELEGEVDEFGMARAVGEADFFDPTGFMDLRVLFKNVEMTRLTPYVATFAGRKIDSGKLSLDLQYQIKARQLLGENQVIVDRLKLGERVDSPSAKDLPLDLAIALLEDSDGRIDLGLPIAGSLDDPQFSYGSIIWKAITNVLTKIVTAPFRALGALFGGGDEKIDSVVFEAGARQPTPPEREKLTKLAGALVKRPNLHLAIGGAYAEADRVALQDVQLRRTLLKASGERANEERDPGPVSTALPKVRTALDELYVERVGAADLAALKEGFRQANPGQLEESVGGRMMSRLSGLLREKKTLSAGEVEQLKGADFYTVLYERLRARENVGDERLQALAQTRAEFARNTLRTAGVAPERIVLKPAEKIEPAEGGIPLKLALETARKD